MEFFVFVFNLLMFIIILFLVVFIIMLIALMKIMKKVGEEGWIAFIPVYPIVVLCKKIGINPLWIAILLFASLLSSLPFIGALLCILLYIYFTFIFFISLARSFGKSDYYAMGLIFLFPIFYLKLAFDKNDEYLGPRPANDFVLGSLKENSGNNINDEYKYCTNCGCKLSKDCNFCTQCGNECK